MVSLTAWFAELLGPPGEEHKRVREIALALEEIYKFDAALLGFYADISRTVAGAIIAVARDMGYQAFEAQWKYARLAVPLQVRLAAEQGLWELGGKYRQLITGFRPVEEKQRKQLRRRGRTYEELSEAEKRRG